MPRLAPWMSVVGALACAPTTERAVEVAERSRALPGGVTRAPEERWIRGRVTGANGERVEFGAIALGRLSAPVAEATALLGEDGEFAWRVAEDAGIVAVEISATEHAVLQLPVDTRDGDVELEVRLGSPEPLRPPLQVMLAPVKARGTWAMAGVADWETTGSMPSMELRRGDDGLWSATVEAQAEAVMFLVSSGPSHQLAAMPSGQAAYSMDGWLWAVTPVVAGAARVVVDLERMSVGAAPRVEVTGERSARLVAARLAAIGWGSTERGVEPADAAMCARAAREAGGLGAAGWVYYAQFARARRCGIAEAEARAALGTIAAEDPRWGLGSEALEATLAALGERDAAYEAAVVERQANEHVVAHVLLAQLKAAGGDRAKARPIFRKLREERFDGTFGKAFAGLLDPDRLEVGMPTPEFAVAGLDGPPVTRAGLLGTPHVLDFWGTWCAPCVAEVPRLHAEYAKLLGIAAPTGAAGWRDVDVRRAPRVQFVSISVHEPAGEVEAYRREKWPMPWLHGVAGKESEALMEKFGVGGVPTMFFVDAAGVVVQREGEMAAGLRELLKRAQ